MSNAQHSSASFEHFTPPEYVEVARTVLEGIDLDPASCSLADEAIVHAREFYSLENGENGFLKPWYGRVFVNPPGGSCDNQGRPVVRKNGARQPCTMTGACGLPAPHTHEGVGSSQRAWWRKLVREWWAGAVEQAIFVSFSIELLQNAQDESPETLTPLDFPICFPRKRVTYWSEKSDGRIAPGLQPTHASMFVYLPPGEGTVEAVDRFVKAFSPFGKVINQ